MNGGPNDSAYVTGLDDPSGEDEGEVLARQATGDVIADLTSEIDVGTAGWVGLGGGNSSSTSSDGCYGTRCGCSR
jgi:hypothetical protein